MSMNPIKKKLSNAIHLQYGEEDKITNATYKILKQEMIEFAEWVSNNNWVSYGVEFRRWDIIKKGFDYKTSTELFDLYLESKTKKQ